MTGENWYFGVIFVWLERQTTVDKVQSKDSTESCSGHFVHSNGIRHPSGAGWSELHGTPSTNTFCGPNTEEQDAEEEEDEEPPGDDEEEAAVEEEAEVVEEEVVGGEVVEEEEFDDDQCVRVRETNVATARGWFCFWWMPRYRYVKYM